MPNDYNDEAKVLASQARQFDEARRQTANAPSIDKALGVIDYAAMAPEGHPDPKGYVLAMAAKGSDGVASNGSAPSSSPRPRVLSFESYGFTRAAADAKPGDLVELDLGNGRTTTVEVEQAVKLGFLRHDREGGYRGFRDDEVAQEKAEQQRQQQEEDQQKKADIDQKRLTGDAPDADLQHTIDIVNSWVPGEATMTLIEDAVSNGTVSMENLTKVAKHSGLTVGQAQQLATRVWDGVYRQASLALTSSGIPAEEVDAVFAYAAEHHAFDHKGAIRVLALNNDTSVFRELASRYKAHKLARSQR